MVKTKTRPFVIKHNLGFDIVFCEDARKAFVDWAILENDPRKLSIEELKDVGFDNLIPTGVNNVWEPTYAVS